MKTIKIPCPKCAAVNHYTNAALTASKGQAQCTACQHVFTLVRKKTTPSQPASRTPDKPSTPEHKDDLLATNGWKKASGSPNSTPLQAEVLPKAGAGQHRPLAEPDNDKHFQAEAAIEALLQRNAGQPPANLPVPSIDTLLKNVQNQNAAGGPTQNIHIQAQSLVFNLVSGKEAPNHLLQQPPLLLGDGGNNEDTANETATATKKTEFNWTLACLVALTTLIVQIFYYFLTRM